VKEKYKKSDYVDICYRKIHQDLVESLVDNILGHYDEISTIAVVSQAQALQLLLDVKYLTMLLVPRDNKVMGNFEFKLCIKKTVLSFVMRSILGIDGKIILEWILWK
jgi:hypothetical protein